MKRRDFITLLGGATAWPLAARAQQSGKLPTIGFLGESTPAGQRQWAAAFVQRLRELGWVEGRNIAIEYRWAEGRNERFAELVAELGFKLIKSTIQGLRRGRQMRGSFAPACRSELRYGGSPSTC